MKHTAFFSTLRLFSLFGLVAGWVAPLEAAASSPEGDDPAASGEVPPEPGSAPELEASSEPVMPLELESPACGGRRWVSFGEPSAGGSCTPSGGFGAEPLFPPEQGLPAELAGYCLHTWTGAEAPSEKEISDWKSGFPAGELAEDCAFVTPLGAYEDHLATMLRGAIASRIGVVTGAPAPAPSVHVAVIDTAPDAPAGLPALGNNRHGDTLAALVADVLQVPGAATISTTLAMPWATDPATGMVVYSLSGGDYGYLSDLSRALRRAVVEHRASHAGERLVMNLSLGWEPRGTSSACTGNLLPAARAVRAVLDDAACKDGALIVAAAGNHMGGPSPGTGLMCPAAWMSEAPSCTPQRPLVIAAYGLDHGDAPLAVARPGSATPFGAPALGGVAWSAGAPAPAPLTGTSVSAAAVTASIAAVWAAAPDLNGEAVTGLLYEHSVSIGASADVCSGLLPGCGVHRISPCGALSAAGSPWTCESSHAPSPVSNPDLDAATRAAFSASVSGAAAVPATAGAAALPSELAPAAGAQGTIHPQPIIPVCPSCAVALGLSGASASNPVFYGSLSRSVSALVLVVQSSTSASRYSISAASASSTFSVTLPTSAVSTRSAWISGTDAVTGLAIVEQVLVVQ